MGSHPINLFFRFILELLALTVIGIWGWKLGEGLYKYTLSIGIPIVLATIWGVFAVPDDPSRSGAAPVVVSGIVRLIIELAIFAFAAWSLHNIGYSEFCIIFGIAVLAHYILSYDRIIWLFTH